MPKAIKTPFSVERSRDSLARKGNYKKLLKTYSTKLPEITDLNTPKLWDKLNKRNHLNWGDSPMTMHKLNIISSFIPNNNLDILNVGCGSGDLENIVFNKYKELKFHWQGIDISPKSILSCKKEFGRKAVFSIGDIRKLNFENESFDILVLMEIMEHIKPSVTFRALKEVRRVLKKRGKLIVSVPTNEGLEEMETNPNAHVRTYTLNLIKAELEIAGFKVLETRQLTAYASLYWLKYIIGKHILRGLKKPNSIIVFAEKS